MYSMVWQFFLTSNRIDCRTPCVVFFLCSIDKSLKIPNRVIRSRRSKDRQYSGQTKKDKQWSTKHNMNPTKNRGWTPVLWKGKQLLLHQWHPSRYSWYNLGELRCSGRISSSCFTNDIRRVTPVTLSVICHEWGKVSTRIHWYIYYYISTPSE